MSLMTTDKKNRLPVTGTVTRQGTMPATRGTRQTLHQIDEATLMRVGTILSDGIVGSAKVNEIDRLSRQAMMGQAMLHRLGAAMARGDVFMADDMIFFTELAKVAKGDLILQFAARLAAS